MIPPRTRSGEARAAVETRANAARRLKGGSRAGTRGGHTGGNPLEVISSPFPRIAREGNFLTEGGTDPTRRAPGTESCNTTSSAGTEKTHTRGDVGGVCGIGKGISEHPRTEETCNRCPSESQASQKPTQGAFESISN